MAHSLVLGAQGWNLYCPVSQLHAGLWSFSASVLLIFQTESFFGGGGELLCTLWHLCPLPIGRQQHSFRHICDSPKCLQSSNILKGTPALDENHGGQVTVTSSVLRLAPAMCYPRISASTQVPGHWLVLTGTPVTAGICLLPHWLFPLALPSGLALQILRAPPSTHIHTRCICYCSPNGW